MTAKTDQLYRQVTMVTEDYLGPAAERFVSRQIASHLNKNPKDLTVSDLPKFIQWATVTFGLLTEDSNIVDEYEQRLTQLIHTEGS